MQIIEGLRLQVRIQSDAGVILTQGSVTTIGRNHFKVLCDRKFDEHYFNPDQESEVRPAEDLRTLPLATRLVRFSRNNPSELVVKLPSGDWKQNNRSFVRVPAKLKAVIIRSDDTVETGTTVNISGSGALIETTSDIPIGNKFRLVLELPDGESPPIEAEAISRRLAMKTPEKFQVGVEFLQIAQRDQDRVCRLVLVIEFERRRQGYHN